MCSVALWLLCHLLQYLALGAAGNGGVEQLEGSFFGSSEVGFLPRAGDFTAECVGVAADLTDFKPPTSLITGITIGVRRV